MNITEPSFDEREIELLRECLDSKWVTQGPMTERFEKSFAECQAVKHALACTSCTAALHLATSALELGPGDEVVVPAFTWVTSAHAAEYVGAKAVFADIDLNTFNISPEALADAITPSTKAVVAVHLFGLAAPMDEILEICQPRGIRIIEDAACGVATTYNGQPVGGIGDIGCFSFHPRKVITTGEGGMVTTNDDDLDKAIRSLRNHGATGLPSEDIEPHGPWSMTTFNRIGFNLRLSDIQAAVGIAQMEKLENLVQSRIKCARRYDALLEGSEVIVRPMEGNRQGHTYQSYVIRLHGQTREKRNKVMAALAAENIQTRPGTHAAHQLGYYRDKYGLAPEAFPNAVLAEDTSITLPIFPGMTEDQQEFVASKLLAAMEQ